MASAESEHVLVDADAFACFGSSSSEEDDDDNNHELVAHKTALARGRHFVNKANERHHNPQPIYPVTSPSDYEIVETGASGKGVRSCRPFARGDEILREGAVLRYPRYRAATTAEGAAEQHAEEVRKRFNRLHPKTQACVMQLACNCGDAPATPLGVCKTNCYELQDERDDGLFLTISRFNHSCRPNVNHAWRPDLQMFVVFATQDIAVGEAMYTTYGPPEGLDTEGRRSWLEERFGFHCMCDMCQEGNPTSGEDRMVQIGNLKESIDLLARSGQHEAAIDAIVKCLQLMDEGGLGTGVFVIPILRYGYQVSLMGLNDETMAKSYLTKELTAVQYSQGIDSPKAMALQSLLDRLTGVA